MLSQLAEQPVAFVHEPSEVPATLKVILVIVPGDTLACPDTDTLLPLTVAPLDGAEILTVGAGGAVLYHSALGWFAPHEYTISCWPAVVLLLGSFMQPLL